MHPARKKLKGFVHNPPVQLEIAIDSDTFSGDSEVCAIFSAKIRKSVIPDTQLLQITSSFDKQSSDVNNH